MGDMDMDMDIDTDTPTEESECQTVMCCGHHVYPPRCTHIRV